MRVNREPRIAACGLGLEPGPDSPEFARGSCSPSRGGGEYRVLSFTSISENALSFNILFFFLSLCPSGNKGEYQVLKGSKVS